MTALPMTATGDGVSEALRARIEDWYSIKGREPGAPFWHELPEAERNRIVKIVSFFAALPSPDGTVAVKALEWTKWDQRSNGGSADSLVGHYHVWTHHEANGQWFWRLTTTGVGPVEAQGDVANEAEGKAACQADYETRIRSSLVPINKRETSE